MFKLRDFFASYPEQDDPDIQTLLSNKQELREIVPDMKEETPERGKLYNHQKIFFRIFKNYNKGMIFHRAGVGKNSAYLSLAEYYKKLIGSTETLINENPHINRVYFLVKGDSIKNEIRNQIVYKATPKGTYDTSNVLTADNASKTKNAITRNLKDWYTIYGFRELKNRLVNMTDAQIISEFSGSLIFIDEVHNLQNEEIEYESKQGEKTVQIKENDDETEESESSEAAALISSTYVSEHFNESKSEKIYDQIYRLVHLIKRSKVFLGSATPMINEPIEFITVMNLILPLDRQLRLDSFDWSRVSVRELEPYIRGLITYVRELDTGIKINEVGDYINTQYSSIDSNGNSINIKSEIKVYNTTMSEFQDYSYRIAESKSADTTFYLNERAVSNFVFPDGSWGGKIPNAPNSFYSELGIEVPNPRGRPRKNPEPIEPVESVIQTPRKIRVKKPEKNSEELRSFGVGKYAYSPKNDEYIATSEFAEYLSDLENIRNSSCKYYEILLRYNSKIGPVHTENPGTTFIYSDIKTGSGPITLGLCMEAQGYIRFTETDSVFVNEIINGVSTERKIIKSAFSKKLRYAFISGNTPSTRVNSILELFNSDENMDGEYIKVLIGSRVTRDGINFQNVRNFELLSAGWHMSGIYQALYRILRSTSHEKLIQRARAKDPNAEIKVNIYRNAAISLAGESIDLKLYTISEDKDIKIKRLERIMVECAVDCLINIKRNKRITDIDYSSACFYDKCDYTGVSQESTNLKPINLLDSRYKYTELKNPNLDYSTFDLYYTDDLLNLIINRLKDLFRSYENLSINLISTISEFSEFPEKYLILALYKIKRENIQFYNRLGFPVYLHLNGSNLYLSKSYNSDINNNFYVSNNIYTINRNLSSFLYINDSTADSIIQSILEYDSEDSDVIENYLSKLLVSDLSRLIEIVIDSENDSFGINYVYDKYESYIFKIQIPINAINQSLELYKSYNNKALHKNISKEFKNIVLKSIDLFDYETKSTEYIYAHTIYNLNNSKTKYTESVRMNTILDKIRIRINGVWRDSNIYEYPVYKYVIESVISQSLTEFESIYDIYGRISDSDVFKIIDNRKSDYSNNRDINRGRDCKNFKKPEIVQILATVKDDLELSSESLDEMKQFLSFKKYEPSKLSDSEIIKYYSILKNYKTQDDMCLALREYFITNDRIYK
jgi:hypothetical protein